MHDNAKKRYRTVVNKILTTYHAICSIETLCKAYGVTFVATHANEIKEKTLEKDASESAKKKKKEMADKAKVIASLTIEDLREHNPDLLAEIQGVAILKNALDMTKELKQITLEMIDTVKNPGIDEDVKQEYIDRWHEDVDATLTRVGAMANAMENSDSSPQTPHQNGVATKRQYKCTICNETGHTAKTHDRVKAAQFGFDVDSLSSDFNNATKVTSGNIRALPSVGANYDTSRFKKLNEADDDLDDDFFDDL